ADLTRGPCDLDQDERELADLAEPDPDTHRGRPWIAKRPHDRGPDHELAEDDHRHQHRHQPPVARHRSGVDERANGDEEPRDEDAADLQQTYERPVRVFGAIDDQPGQERAQRERQSRGMRHRGRAEPDGEHDQKEELIVRGRRHTGQNSRHGPRGKEDEGHHDDAGLAEGEGQGDQAIRRQHAQRGQDDGQDDDGEVLDQGNSDHDPPERRVERLLVQQQTGQHHRARDRDDRAQRNSLSERPAKGAPDSQGQRDRQHDAERAADEGDPFHAQQVVQRELDADGEHQKHDGDFGELLERVYVGHGRSRRERPDDDAADHVAEDERLTRQPGQYAADEGGADDVGEVTDEERVVYHAMVGAGTLAWPP